MNRSDVEKLIEKDVKDIVDLLFDTECLRPELTRKSMSAFEEYLKSVIICRAKSLSNASRSEINITKTLN
jgi:hypothetical protein